MTYPTLKNLLILASGNGSNAENIANYFANHHEIKVTLIGSNKPDAFVLQRAKKLGIPTFTFTKQELTDPSLSSIWRSYHIDYIILAGFLLKIPSWLIKKYSKKIINIHPALLPLYGGKGMYGMNVHNAVYENKEEHTGITIHLVNEQYDEGQIIFQASVALSSTDLPENIAEKIHSLEYNYFPSVIEDYINTHSPDS